MTGSPNKVAVDSSCKRYKHLLGAYVDGQLEPGAVLEVDEHVEGCEACRERIELDRSIRGSLRRAVRVTAPDGMRSRVAAAMVAERARGVAREARASRSSSWRTMVPLASAAALAMVWGAATRGPIDRTVASSAMSPDTVRGGVDDELIQELVAEHSNPLPPERTDPKDVRAFERYVGVPVHPVNFEKRAGARLVGGRMMPVHAELAAMLQYEIGTGADVRRVSVIIYDPRRIQVRGEELAPRAVGTSEVRVGRSNGYSVAVTQRDGVGYAIASDLGPERSAELASYAEE